MHFARKNFWPPFRQMSHARMLLAVYATGCREFFFLLALCELFWIVFPLSNNNKKKTLLWSTRQNITYDCAIVYELYYSHRRCAASWNILVCMQTNIRDLHELITPLKSQWFNLGPGIPCTPMTPGSCVTVPMDMRNHLTKWFFFKT